MVAGRGARVGMALHMDRGEGRVQERKVDFGRWVLTPQCTTRVVAR